MSVKQKIGEQTKTLYSDLLRQTVKTADVSKHGRLHRNTFLPQYLALYKNVYNVYTLKSIIM